MPFHPKRMLLFPCRDLRKPFFCLALFHILRHLRKRFFGICYDWNIHMNISGNRCRIDINMDNLCMRRKFMQFSRDPVIKARPDGKQQITAADCHIGCISAVHPQISDKQRMICRNGASPHDRCHYRHLCFFHHFCKQCTGARNIHPSACQKQRSFCLVKHLDRSFQLSDMYTGIRLISSDIHLFRILCTAKLRHHIFRKIDQNRSRPSRSCDIKCLLDDPSKIFPLRDRHTILGDAPCDPHNIHFLKCIISDQMSRHLSGKTDQRNTVIIGSRKSCHQIGRSRSAGHQTDADFPRCPRIRIRFMHQCLLVSRKDHINPALLIQLIADIDRTRARISEQYFYVFFF